MGSYVHTILTAVIAFPFTALLFTFPYIICSYRKYGSVLSFRILVVYSFILYLLCVYFLVILPLPSIDEVARMTGPRVQPVPFMFIRDILTESSFRLGNPSTWLSLVKNAAFFQVFYNFLMIMPFGIYLRYYFRCGFKRTLLFSFLLSLFFELTQLTGLYFIYPRGYRLFDVDDLMVNTLGGAAGYLCAPALMRLLPSRENMDRASLRRGQEISLPRRLLALGFDLILIFVINCILYALVPGEWTKDSRLFLPLSFLYYTLVPGLTGGRTLGKVILRMRIAGTDGARPGLYQYALRCGSLLVFLFAAPPLLSLLLTGLSSVGLLPDLACVLLSLCTFLGWFSYLLWTALLAVRHRPLFYERLSRTRNVSTVPFADEET